MKKILLSTTLLVMLLSFDSRALTATFLRAEDETALIAGTETQIEVRVIDNRLQVDLPENLKSGKVVVFDLLGNQVFESNSNSNIDFSMAGQKSGIYFVVWKDGKTSLTKKFVYKQEG
jgi:hypothetical protein